MWLYRIAVSLLSLGVIALCLWRCVRGRETRTDLDERLGGGAGQAPAIWIHGASNGELTAGRRLIEALCDAYPGHQIVVTCNTVTGRDLVQGWGISDLTARLAPLDLRWCLARFIGTWHPRALITLENELWPNRVATLSGPLLFVAARMSKTSARRWRKMPRFARMILSRIDFLAPQDSASGERFCALGLRPEALGPLYAPKSGVSLQPPDPAELASLARVFPRDETWLAASTHEGEDEIILDALRQSGPKRRLILAPRHPKRGADIRRLAESKSLTVAQRSRGEAPNARVYIVDTLGEMALWYSLASMTFVGGSLVQKGGHTPFEPAQFKSALLHGPHTSNFSDVYRGLMDAGGSYLVTDATSLCEALERLTDGSAKRRLVAAADVALAPDRDLAETHAQILAALAKGMDHPTSV